MARLWAVVMSSLVHTPPVRAVLSMMVAGEERDRLMARLRKFREFKPQTYDGEKPGYWVFEKWILHMEKLLHDTFVAEGDRVWLATYHLQGDAYQWWTDNRDDPMTDLAAITWPRFKKMLAMKFFSASTKGRMERDLRNFRQGDNIVAEYEREFTRLLNCIAHIVRDDEDKARLFENGLRPSTFRLVQTLNLQTYREVVDRALIVEKGAEIAKEEREALGRSRGKRSATEGASRKPYSKKPPKHPRSQSGGRDSSSHRGRPDRRRPPRCVICRGPHVPPQCP